MSYWAAVHRRAYAEAKELVRLDRPGRIFVALTTILAPAAIAYLLTPKSDPLIRALSSVGALLFAGAAIYAWKLLSLPAQLAQEDQARATAEALAAKSEFDATMIGAAAREEAQAQTIAALQAEIAALKAPKAQPVDPDAILQYGRKVGSVIGARQIGGMWCFDSITVGADFSSAAPFQYRDYLLEVGQAQGQMQRGGAGQIPQVTVIQPVCRVIGRA